MNTDERRFLSSPYLCNLRNLRFSRIVGHESTKSTKQK